MLRGLGEVRIKIKTKKINQKESRSCKMQLSQKAIQEFQAIYSEDYGVELSDEKAREEATSFFHAMRAAYKPIPKEHYNKHQNEAI